MTPAEQRAFARERSREVRVARGRILKSLRTGRLKLADIDLDAPELATMPVLDLLADIRWNHGPPPTKRTERKPKAWTRAKAFCERYGIDPALRLRQLSKPRKRELALMVTAEVPAQQAHPWANWPRGDEHPLDTFSHPNDSAVLLADWPFDA